MQIKQKNRGAAWSGQTQKKGPGSKVCVSGRGGRVIHWNNIKDFRVYAEIF